MIQFTINGIKQLGDYDEKYGQRFWAETPDGDLPLMFNVMDADFADNLENGQFQIVAEEKDPRTSGKGTAYLMLKKVKLVEKPTAPAQTVLSKETVDEVFNDEMGAEAPDLAQATLKQSVDTTITLAQSVKDSLDRIETAIQELDSKLDRLGENEI